MIPSSGILGNGVRSVVVCSRTSIASSMHCGVAVCLPLSLHTYKLLADNPFGALSDPAWIIQLPSWANEWKTWTDGNYGEERINNLPKQAGKCPYLGKSFSTTEAACLCTQYTSSWDRETQKKGKALWVFSSQANRYFTHHDNRDASASSAVREATLPSTPRSASLTAAA